MSCDLTTYQKLDELIKRIIALEAQFSKNLPHVCTCWTKIGIENIVHDIIDQRRKGER